MNINDIAKITLTSIYGTCTTVRSLNFMKNSYNLHNILSLHDNRTIEDIEMWERDPNPIPDDYEKENDLNDIHDYFLWGIKIGLEEMPMYEGDKSLLDRIAGHQKILEWGFAGKSFSHLVVERIVGVKNGYPLYEIDVYNLKKNQVNQILEKASTNLANNPPHWRRWI